MANPILNESAVYGGTPQAEPDTQVVGDEHPDWTLDDAFLANELLIDDDGRAQAQAERDADAFELPQRDRSEPAAVAPEKTADRALHDIMQRNFHDDAFDRDRIDGMPASEAGRLARADQADYVRLDAAGKEAAASVLVENFRNRAYAVEFARLNPDLAQEVIRHDADIKARKAVQQNYAGLLAVPNNELSPELAREIVEQDIASLRSIAGREDRHVAAVLMGNNAESQKAYLEELNRQAPEIAKEAGAAVQQVEHQETVSPRPPKAEKPKQKRTSKAKEASVTEPAKAKEAAAPAPAPAPPGIADLDPHAQQRLDRVSSNRATDLAEARRTLDADAATRARIHLLQDPNGRHIVAIDQGGVTKAYAVDENPGIAAKTVNKLRDGIRKIGNLAGEINFLPDVIKTRFRLKGGEERIAYNVDPEGVDPRHPQMREAGLGENDRRNLVVIPDGNPDELSKRILLSADLPDDVKKRFVHSDTVPGQFFDRNRKLAFIDKGGRLATDQNAPEIIASMVSVAQTKGWQAITVKGHEDFRREAWLAASLAGIEVKGFKPSEPDLVKLEHERQQRMGNAIQPVPPTPAPAANEIVGTRPEAQGPALGAEAIALGEVARLKGVREDQIPDFMKAAQSFVDEAKRAGIALPPLKIFDPKAPAAPAVTLPDKTKEPAHGIAIAQPDMAPKR